jgi:DNA-binding response OmpR family regulator
VSKILLIIDEPDMAQALKAGLTSEAYQVEIVHRWEDVSARVAEDNFDAAIIDLSFKAIDAAAICHNFRRGGGMVPILILAADGSVEECVKILDAGADELINKPFQLPELICNLKAMLRRPAVVYGLVLAAEDLLLDTMNLKVSRNDRSIQLHPKEFSLLEFFMRHPNQIFSAESLWAQVWKSDSSTMLGSVRTHIKTLRAKITGPDTTTPLIVTVHGKGYKLETGTPE